MTINEVPLSWLPLADAVVKASLILGAAGLTALILRRASAALRHLVWTLALCSALLLPIVSLALPKWQLPLITFASPAPPVQSKVERKVANTLESTVAPHAAEPVDPLTATAPPPLGRAGHADAGTAPDSVATIARAEWLPSVSWQSALIGIWLLGAGAILGRIAVGLVAVRFLSRRTQLITDAEWLPMAMDIAEEMGVTPRLRFLRSGRASMPVATGLFRPSVIMPADADSWSESRLRVVLLHELAHVKRRDCLTHVLAQAACAFYWFNPLAWLAVKRARAERERACDDLVLACGTRGSEYADLLLEMARVLRGDRFPALLGGASLAMAHRSQLEGRLMAILDPKVPRSGLTRARALAVVAVACFTVAPLAALQPWGSHTEITRYDPSADAPSAAVETPEPAVTSVLPEPQAQPAPRPAPMPAPRGIEQQERETETEHESDAHAASHTAVQALGSHVATAVQASAAVIAESVHEAVAEIAEQEPKVAGAKGGEPKADPRMVAALTAALKDTDKEVRETAMHALVQMRDPSIVEPLLQALKDPSPDVREQAAFGLGQMRDRRAVQPLMGSLKDENASVREQAAFALGQLRDPAAVEGLAAAVRDANPEVREQAVFALSQIRDRRAVEPLISALKDTNPDVREKAAFALGQLRDKAAVDALMVAVKDSVADVREQVVFALGQLRDPRAIDALTTALKDQNADVRKNAAFALGQLAR
jgi:HEAT repeat protein/beta-lactamase regulating signal transducer with metallopeptidase domain